MDVHITFSNVKRQINAIAKRIFKRSISIGLSRHDASRLSDLTRKVLSDLGLEGGVTRFKALRDAYNHWAYGTPQYPGWVKRNGYGCPRALEFLSKYPAGIVFRALACFNTVVLEKFTVRQVSKRLDPIVTPLTTELDPLLEMINLGVLGDGYLDQIDERCKPVLNSKTVESFRYLLRAVTGHPDFISLFTEDQQNQVWFPFYWTEIHERAKSVRGFRSIGHVRMAQEPGAKSRLFADPHPVFQAYLEPVHALASRIRSLYPTDCTYDQEKGARFASQCIRDGRTVFSLDLAAATCRFPLEAQIFWLNRVGCPDYLIRAFTYAATGDWSTDIDAKVPLFVSWVRGQPLGLKPSMSVFSATHNALLWGICSKLNKVPENTFRVLGDDVVIADASVATLYTELLGEVGVEVSTSKSRVGALAEFAGFQVTSGEVIRPGKWKEALPHNYIHLALDLGCPTPTEVSKGYAKIQKVVLFREGKYDPPSDEWSYFIHAASCLSSSPLSGLEGIPKPFHPTTLREWIKTNLSPTVLQPDRPWFQDVFEPIARLFLTADSGTSDTQVFVLYFMRMISEGHWAEGCRAFIEACVPKLFAAGVPFDLIVHAVDESIGRLYNNVKVTSSRRTSRTWMRMAMSRGILRSLLAIA